jgi:hypothetical protein
LKTIETEMHELANAKRKDKATRARAFEALSAIRGPDGRGNECRVRANDGDETKGVFELRGRSSGGEGYSDIQIANIEVSDGSYVLTHFRAEEVCAVPLAALDAVPRVQTILVRWLFEGVTR